MHTPGIKVVLPSDPYNARGLLAVLCALPLAGALAADEITMTNPGDIKWGDAPPNMPKGAKVAVLYGDPSKAGPFTMRQWGS